MWIINGLYADYYFLAARTGLLEARHKAVTVFIMPMGGCRGCPDRGHGRQVLALPSSS